MGRRGQEIIAQWTPDRFAAAALAAADVALRDPRPKRPADRAVLELLTAADRIRAAAPW